MASWCTDPVRNTILSAAGALIRDEHDRVLLVEPNYKDHWEIPGGIIEVGETPSQGCAREITEELGLTREPGRLLVVDWAPHPEQGDRVLFIFDGGVLTGADTAAIRLQPDELDSYVFLDPAAALDRLIPRLARRVGAALRARADGGTVYLEHGIPY
jgi:ADP-ribose pyrophosphatase YjhB (NUDIX family)